ncbi:MAG: efflux RND transporter permease subunit [bacterium]|nr:efflux RND transporter permease subunit [bacterium]
MKTWQFLTGLLVAVAAVSAFAVQPRRSLMPPADLGRIHLYAKFSDRDAAAAERDIAIPLETFFMQAGRRVATELSPPELFESVETRVQSNRATIEAQFVRTAPEELRSAFYEQIAAFQADDLVSNSAPDLKLQVERIVTTREAIAEVALPIDSAAPARVEQQIAEIRRDLKPLKADAEFPFENDGVRTIDGESAHILNIRGGIDADHVHIVEAIEANFARFPETGARFAAFRNSRLIYDRLRPLPWIGALIAVLSCLLLWIFRGGRVALFVGLDLCVLFALWHASLSISGAGLNLVSAAILPGGLLFAVGLLVFAAGAVRDAQAAPKAIPVMIAGAIPLLLVFPVTLANGPIGMFLRPLQLAASAFFLILIPLAILVQYQTREPGPNPATRAIFSLPGRVLNRFASIGAPALSALVLFPAVVIAGILLTFPDLKFTLFTKNSSGYRVALRNTPGSSRAETERDMRMVEKILTRHASRGLLATSGVGEMYTRPEHSPRTKYAPHFATVYLQYEPQGSYEAEELAAILETHWPIVSKKPAEIRAVRSAMPIVLPEPGAPVIEVRKHRISPPTGVVDIRVKGAPSQQNAAIQALRQLLEFEPGIAGVEDEVLEYTAVAAQFNRPELITRWNGESVRSLRVFPTEASRIATESIVDRIIDELSDFDLELIPLPEPRWPFAALFAAALCLLVIAGIIAWACVHYRSLLPVLIAIIPGPVGGTIVSLFVLGAAGEQPTLIWIASLPLLTASAMIPVLFALDHLRQLTHAGEANADRRLWLTGSRMASSTCVAAIIMLVSAVIAMGYFPNTFQRTQWLVQIACAIYIAYLSLAVTPAWLWLEDGLRNRGR